MSDSKLVSIITPTYNCGSFIADTIKSVQAQSYPNWEMIIVDDCSSDHTEDIVSKFSLNDSRIKYICLKKNSGAAVARNLALQMAKGRWIAFLDSDDLWTPNKLKSQLKFMQEKDFAFTYHPYEEIDEHGNLLGVTVTGKKVVSKFGMKACCWPGCLSVMYDRSKIGLVQIADIKKNNDSALWLKVIKKSKCHYLNEKLAYYRRRKGSITPPNKLTKIKWHYKLFREAEKMNPFSSFFWMFANIIGNSYKKIFYVKRN